MGELVDPRILYRISDFFSEYLRTSQEKFRISQDISGKLGKGDKRWGKRGRNVLEEV